MKKRLIKLPTTSGAAIGLWEMAGPDNRLPPVLLVHGATFGAAIFDLPAPGYSLMNVLASGGRRIFAIDVRGYGSSMDCAAMNAPAEREPPFSTCAEAVNDIEAAVA